MCSRPLHKKNIRFLKFFFVNNKNVRNLHFKMRPQWLSGDGLLNYIIFLVLHAFFFTQKKREAFVVVSVFQKKQIFLTKHTKYKLPA